MKNVSLSVPWLVWMVRLFVFVAAFASARLLQAGLLSTAEDGEVTITGYTGNETNLVIPAVIDGLPVTRIGDSGFGDFGDWSGVITVSIPSSVTSISEGMFGNSLASIVVDSANPAYSSVDGLLLDKAQTRIIAVPGAKKWGGFVIPNGVKSIDRWQFSWCRGLTSVNIPSSMTSIGDGAFSGCSGLSSVVIPSSVTSIGEGAFRYCSGLTRIDVQSQNPAYASVEGVLMNRAGTKVVAVPAGKTGAFTIPKGVTSIGADAFSGCSGLSSVVIPSSVTSLGAGAFSGCSGLTSVVISSSVTSIGDSAFSGCSGLSSVVIPSSVTSIGDSAFSGCRGLSSVVIPSSVTSIGDSALSGCRGLSSVVIPRGVTSIGERAFDGCSGLTKVVIPSSVTSIASSAFDNCAALTSIDVETQNTVFSSVDGVLMDKAQTEVIEIPKAKTGIFALPASLTIIGDSQLSGCGRLTSFVVDSGNTAFSSVRGVLMNKDRTRIVMVPASQTGIFTISKDVTLIDPAAFDNCAGLTSIEVEPQNIAFSSVNGVLMDKARTAVLAVPVAKTGTFVIPSGVQRIPDWAFRGRCGLTSVSIPASVTSIGIGSFSGCMGLTSMNIPSGVTAIGAGAFSGCRALTRISIPSSATAIGSGAFLNCSKLTSLSIPNGVVSIGDGAFTGCAGLTSLSIPASVTSLDVEDSVFVGCSGIASINVDSGNPKYSSLGGVLMNKARTRVIQVPAAKTGTVTLPASVRDSDHSSIRNAFAECRGLSSIAVESGNPWLKSVDGVLYNHSLTELLAYPAMKSGPCVITRTVLSLPSSLQRSNAITSFHVEPQNPCFKSVNGVFFDKNGSTLLRYPAAKAGPYTIPSSVLFISGYAFAGCRYMSSVAIPTGVVAFRSSDRYFDIIGAPESFPDCTALEAITVAPQNQHYTSEGGVLFNKNKSTLLCYPVAKSGAYTLPNSVSRVAPVAFSNCRKLTSVSFPRGLTEIGERAFSGCTGLSSVSIPSSVATLGFFAFDGCSNLSGLTFNGNAPDFHSTFFDLVPPYIFPSFVYDASSVPLGSLSPKYKTTYFTSKRGFTSPFWAGYPSSGLPGGNGL